MNSRERALQLAADHLRNEASSLTVRNRGARRDRRLGLWRVGYYDPEFPDVILDGGELAVWDDGRVESVSSANPLMSECQMEFRMSLMSAMNLPPDWLEHLSSEADKQYWEDLQIFLRDERADHEVYPGEEQVFDAFRLCSYEDTRVVILGQDPYHQPDQAHGLSFSVPFGTRRPRSLINIYKELEAEDFPFVAPQHGNLESWARQGVLLLNTSLTVRNSEPGKNGHREHWEKFTDRVLDVLNQKPARVVFILWGGSARAKARLIDKSWHCVIQSAHPTARPNAHDPFLGSRPFSRANACLEAAGLEPINWASVSELGVAEPS